MCSDIRDLIYNLLPHSFLYYRRNQSEDFQQPHLRLRTVSLLACGDAGGVQQGLGQVGRAGHPRQETKSAEAGDLRLLQVSFVVINTKS